MPDASYSLLASKMSTELIPSILLPALLISRRMGTQNMHIRPTNQPPGSSSHYPAPEPRRPKKSNTGTRGDWNF